MKISSFTLKCIAFLSITCYCVAYSGLIPAQYIEIKFILSLLGMISMPIIAFLAQMLTSVLSMLMQKKNNPGTPTMGGMLLTMPLISLFIGFALPGGVTFYWACSSLIGGFIQLPIQNFYGPHKMLARIRSKELANQCEEELKMMKKLSSAGEE